MDADREAATRKRPRAALEEGTGAEPATETGAEPPTEPATEPSAEAKSAVFHLLKRQKLLAVGLNQVKTETVTRLDIIGKASEIINSNLIIMDKKLDYLIANLHSTATANLRSDAAEKLMALFISDVFAPAKGDRGHRVVWLKSLRKFLEWTCRPLCPTAPEVDRDWLYKQFENPRSRHSLFSSPASSRGRPGLTRAQFIEAALVEISGIISGAAWLALRISELRAVLDAVCRDHLVRLRPALAARTPHPPAPPPAPTSIPPPPVPPPLHRVGPIEISVSTRAPVAEDKSPPPTEVETAAPAEDKSPPPAEVETAAPAEVRTAPAADPESPPTAEVETAPRPPREKVKRGAKAERIGKRLAKLGPAKPDSVFGGLAETLAKPEGLSAEGWGALWAVCESNRKRVLQGIRWLARHYFAAGVKAPAAPHIAEAARTLQTLGANSPVLKAVVRRGKKKGHVSMISSSRI